MTREKERERERDRERDRDRDRERERERDAPEIATGWSQDGFASSPFASRFHATQVTGSGLSYAVAAAVSFRGEFTNNGKGVWGKPGRRAKPGLARPAVG